MFSGLYLYIIVVLVFIGVAWWLYSRFQNWWNPSHNTPSAFQPHLQELFLYENGTHHLLRLYLIETHNELDSACTTLSLINDHYRSNQLLWEKIVEKEHHLALTELQRQRLNIHLSLIEERGQKGTSSRKALRVLNRRISELHEDWWGLRFDGSTFMKVLNEMDTAFIQQIRTLCAEEYERSKEDFQSILFFQETLETQITSVLMKS